MLGSEMMGVSNSSYGDITRDGHTLVSVSSEIGMRSIRCWSLGEDRMLHSLFWCGVQQTSESHTATRRCAASLSSSNIGFGP